MSCEEDGYNQYMQDAQASGADQMQSIIETHIGELCKKVISNSFPIDTQGNTYDCIELEVFREIFKDFIK